MLAEINMDHTLEQKLNNIQMKLQAKIDLTNKVRLDEINLAAGVDIAYWSENGADYGVCCIEVVDFSTKEVVEHVEYSGEIEFPYISGYLAFRELPLILKAAKKLKTAPDLFMFDGNGYLHSRHMGIATHASFYLRKPTIGVAKTYSKIGNVEFLMPENILGAFTDIVIDGEVYGRALRTRENVKPVFVSCGNWIDIDSATSITLHFVKNDSRLPITTRYADLATHEARKRLKQK